MTPITLRAIHPLHLSPVAEERDRVKRLTFDTREEARILTLSRELHDRLKRWMNDVNRQGKATEFVSPDAIARIPPSKAGFVPKDRLYIETEGPESVFASDPMQAGTPPPGVAFHARVDGAALAANFDLAPFLESYVRRLSGHLPQYVWQIGEKSYHRTTGLTLLQDPPRFDARRFPAPKHVVDAFGPLPPLPPMACSVCGKADEKAVAQPHSKFPIAHADCVKAKV